MADSSFVTFVCEQLGTLDGVACRAMFGGHGLFAGGAMFGIIYDGQVYLKATKSLAKAEQAAGRRPFQPRPGQILHAFFEISANLLDDSEALCARARAGMGLASPARRIRAPGSPRGC